MTYICFCWCWHKRANFLLFVPPCRIMPHEACTYLHLLHPPSTFCFSRINALYDIGDKYRITLQQIIICMRTYIHEWRWELIIFAQNSHSLCIIFNCIHIIIIIIIIILIMIFIINFIITAIISVPVFSMNWWIGESVNVVEYNQWLFACKIYFHIVILEQIYNIHTCILYRKYVYGRCTLPNIHTYI